MMDFMSGERIGLIGVGGFGEKHLQTIACLEERKLARLVSVADPAGLPELRRSLGAQGVSWFDDYRAMLHAAASLDVVVISTPITWHEEMLGMALKSGVEKVLLEKPPLPTLTQLEELIACDTCMRTRVGFQLIHAKAVRRVKELLVSGRAGRIRSIRVAAGAPRSPAYYARAPWAGRLVQDGRAVFDGPATNALAHLLHNALYFAGPGPHEFALPHRVRGFLGRARDIESYDFAWIEATMGEICLQAALAHCVDEPVPHELRIVTDRGFILFQGKRVTADLKGVEFPELVMEEDHVALYHALLRGGAEPSTLKDVRGFTMLTNAALVSNGIARIPCRQEGEAIRVEGLVHFLQDFCNNPRPPAEAGLDWARTGDWVDKPGFSPLILETYVAG